MRTAYCPKSHVELASETAGRAYGHVPGHHYHDVDVVISETRGRFRAHVVESWGSAQGYDEEHGRREAIGRGESIESACESARERAKAAGIVCEYMEQAMSLAEDAATEAKRASNAVVDMRSRYTIEMTNDFRDSTTPCWRTAIEFAGTPRQCVEKYRDFRRVSSGCQTAVRTTTGPIWGEILEAVIDAE